MDTQHFDRSLGDIAAALGDPTRRGIYMSVRESTEPVTATEIADRFDIHPNVARHHLDRLAADDYLRVTRSRRSGKTGPGAGRPGGLRQAIEKLFEVKVTNVNTLRVRGKSRRRGWVAGKKPDWKKAMVTLADGYSIEMI